MSSSPQKTVILDVVGLSRGLITAEYMPHLHSYISRGGMVDRDIEPAFPALTCPGQSTFFTGTGPSRHGLIGNGFYDRTYCEVKNWHQSAKVMRAPRVWDALKAAHPDATVFVNCLWNGMHDPNIDFFINVRPQYLQDGGKLPDVYTKPAGMREELQGSLGVFPLHRFWGPGTSIQSSRWIADASMAVDKKHNPTLTLMYLPHLDYSLQKYGPPREGGGGDGGQSRVVSDLAEIDEVLRDLLEYYESAAVGARVVILSEYAISRVSRPVYLNRALREQGLVQVRRENGGETLDCGECRAFALCDHQVAHVHVQDPSDIPLVRKTLLALDGVESVMDREELDAHYRSRGGDRRQADSRGAHNAERSGELTVVADPTSWFAYYYWTDDSMAPDFARCVAIHRKPGYDPAEMFFRYPGFWGFAWLMFKLLLVYGLRIRTIVDASPLRCDAIRGSHGRLPRDGSDEPRPLLLFRQRAAKASGAEGAEGAEGEVSEGRDSEGASEADGSGAPGISTSGFKPIGGAKELGAEACSSGDGNVVAEDVYEVIWRVLFGEI